jgi:ketosteroid isomerase-like protein
MLRFALVAAFYLAAGTAFGQDKATIEKLNDAFVAAFGSGDMASLAAMYSEDAYLMPPGAPLMRGRGDIQKFWSAAGEQVGDLKLVTVDVKPLSSDGAREIGTFSLKSKGQQPQELMGKYVVVWQKVQGDWKLAVDIWNMDK